MANVLNTTIYWSDDKDKRVVYEEGTPASKLPKKVKDYAVEQKFLTAEPDPDEEEEAPESEAMSSVNAEGSGADSDKEDSK